MVKRGPGIMQSIYFRSFYKASPKSRQSLNGLSDVDAPYAATVLSEDIWSKRNVTLGEQNANISHKRSNDIAPI